MGGDEEKMIILSLCDLTGNFVQPWLEAGFECWCVDLQHPRGINREGRFVRVGADVTSFMPPLNQAYAFAAHWTPCDNLAVSGARWFADKGLDALHESLGLVIAGRRICEASGAPWFVENPVSTLSSYWRKPDYTFNPCDYAGYLDDPSAEAYTKKTCLWTGGGFVMPEPKAVAPVLGSKMHLLPPSAERANLRSETPKGFARAVFEANYKRVQAIVA